MEKDEIIVDMNNYSPEEAAEGKKTTELLFRLNHTMPGTEEYIALMKALFRGNMGEGSYVAPPVCSVACAENVTMGNRVFINSNALFMARGGITFEDDVTVAANCQFLTNNHDPYQRNLLTCRPILVKKGAWIGAGATINPGVTVGKYAIVGSAAVVTKDVPDYAVVVGIPAKVVKMLDPEKFDD